MTKIQGKGTARMTRRNRTPGKSRPWYRDPVSLGIISGLVAAVVGLLALVVKAEDYERNFVRLGKPGEPMVLRTIEYRGAVFQLLGFQLDGALRVGCLLASPETGEVGAVIQCLQHSRESGEAYLSVRCGSPLVGPERALTLDCKRPGGEP